MNNIYNQLTKVSTYKLCKLTDLIGECTGVKFSYTSIVREVNIDCVIKQSDYSIEATADLTNIYEHCEDTIYLMSLTPELKEYFNNWRINNTTMELVGTELKATSNLGLDSELSLDDFFKLIDKALLKICKVLDMDNAFAILLNNIDKDIENGNKIIDYPGIYCKDCTYHFIDTYYVSYPYNLYTNNWSKQPLLYNDMWLYNPKKGSKRVDGKGKRIYVTDENTIRLGSGISYEKHKSFVLTKNMLQVLEKLGVVHISENYSLVLVEVDNPDEIIQQENIDDTDNTSGCNLKQVDLYDNNTTEQLTLGYKYGDRFIFKNTWGGELEFAKLISLY